MSWIDIAWPMLAAACLTVAFIHLRLGLARPRRPASLLFSLSAFTAAAFAGIELALMRADTTARYWEVLPWFDVAAVVMVASITGFIWVFFGTGNKWLALAGPVTSTVALVFDALPGSRLVYREITGLRTLHAFGATYHVAEGVPNPWNALGYLGVLLALVFVADASWRLWRRGARRRAVVVGGSVLFFVVASGAHSALVDAGIVQTPYLISWSYLAVLIAMARELTDDVFSSMRFEGQLQESEQRFGAMADAAPVMIWMAGIDKLCTFFNHSWLAFTGRTMEQELGNGWTEGVHPADLDGCVRSYIEAFDARRNFTIEYRLRRWDGEHRWILDSGTPRVAADGTFLGYIGSCVDVTELKRAQEHIRLAVEAAPNAMVMVNREGRIILLNAQAEQVFGYARDELLGRSVELLIPEAIRSTHAVDRHAYTLTPSTRPMGAGRDLYGRRKDGREVPVEVGLNPIQTSEGMAILASIVDITARRAMEAEAAQQRDQLAHLARVAMLGELSGSIAHELHQPLAAILSNAEA
ncbi:MAG TPA: PAS domain S-box protein, partial [Gemmatimonadales bacterium]|nr:PAS domain S-box protein [Gemmatimonadales bacterium]